MQNIPDVTVRDRVIPAGRVLLAEYGTVSRDDFSQEHVLDTRLCWQNNRKVRLVARVAGWSIAGSCLRWDNGAFGVLWEVDGSRYGSWYKSFDSALEHFNRLPGYIPKTGS